MTGFDGLVDAVNVRLHHRNENDGDVGDGLLVIVDHLVQTTMTSQR